MADTEQVWLVERDYSDKGMVDLVYTTTDGRRYLHKQLSEQMAMRRDVTAAVDVGDDRLKPTHDDDERERYASEATRMAENHDPDATV